MRSIESMKTFKNDDKSINLEFNNVDNLRENVYM